MRAVKTALIGFGTGGAVFHAPVLRAVEGIELSVLYTSQSEKVKQQYPDVVVTQDLDSIWQHPEIELVVIATPNDTHASLIEAGIRAGKHIVVDKPFVIDSLAGEKLIRLAKEKGVLLSIYQNRRWDGDFLTVQRLIKEGKLGEIMEYRAQYDRYRPVVRDRWKEKAAHGGGVLYDLGAHLIDQALVLFGLPKTVTADCQEQREGTQGTDYFHVVLGYGKSRVMLHVGSFVRRKGPKFAVHGSQASFMKYGEDPQERMLATGLLPNHPGYGEDEPEAYGMLYASEDDPGTAVPTERGRYERFYEMMRDAVIGVGPVPVQAEDALHVVRIIELAERSSREGKTFNYR